jgi:hypothetical protein
MNSFDPPASTDIRNRSLIVAITMLPPRIIALIVSFTILGLIFLGLQIWSYWYTHGNSSTSTFDDHTGNHIPLQPIPRLPTPPIVHIRPRTEYTVNDDRERMIDKMWGIGTAV